MYNLHCYRCIKCKKKLSNIKQGKEIEKVFFFFLFLIDGKEIDKVAFGQLLQAMLE